MTFPVFMSGAGLGASLIVAIGAQNAFVLRQGLTRRHVGLVVAICAVSDLVLILAGTAGVGVLVSSHPRLLTALKWCGAAYLVWFAIRSCRSAAHPQTLQAASKSSRGPARSAAL